MSRDIAELLFRYYEGGRKTDIFLRSFDIRFITHLSLFALVIIRAIHQFLAFC